MVPESCVDTYLPCWFSGYAKDGGLYFPEKIPLLSKDEIEQLAGLSYSDMVKKIMPLFISEEEIPQKDLDVIIDNAFKKFSGKYDKHISIVLNG